MLLVMAISHLSMPDGSCMPGDESYSSYFSVHVFIVCIAVDYPIIKSRRIWVPLTELFPLMFVSVQMLYCQYHMS